MSNWCYEEHGLTRAQAEQRILSLGAVPTEDSGWSLPVAAKHQRLHFKPSGAGINIHVDTSHHHVHNGKKSKVLVTKILEELRK